MRFRDKNGPLHHPIFKPANLPDFLTVARTHSQIFLELTGERLTFGAAQRG
jgi:hypothetical protein